MKRKVKDNRMPNNMQEIAVDLDIADARWEQSLSQMVKLVDEVKSATFNYLQQHENLDFLSMDKPLRIGLRLSNDEEVHLLNREYRHMDKPTNVLSFANMDFENFAAENELFSEIELGDIIIAFETTQREAKEQNITLKAHFCHLLVHGFLHLCGYDHIEAAEAEYMENLERKILGLMQIEDPYKEE